MRTVLEDDGEQFFGMQMEACSVEDGGEGISYNVYVYNVRPGIELIMGQGKALRQIAKKDSV